jgi:hypothetical protein
MSDTPTEPAPPPAPITRDTPIHGWTHVGAALHQWHVGMDAVYAVGSCWYVRRPAPAHVVLDALHLLERSRGYPGRPAQEEAELEGLISEVRERLGGYTGGNTAED